MTTLIMARSTAPVGGGRRAFVRAASIILLVLLELIILDRNYSFGRAVAGAPPEAWVLFNRFIKSAAYVGVFGGVALLLTTLARERTLPAQWLSAAHGHGWRLWLFVEIALFACLVAAAPLFQALDASPPWFLFIAWLVGGALMLTAAGAALAPMAFWLRFARRPASDYLVAAAAGAAIYAAFNLSENSWDALAAATLEAAFAILRLYETQATIDSAAHVLAIGDFRVHIQAACSGYEGIGLVLAIMSFFLLSFRQHLRFPHALLLLPIGAAAIWLFNALRIALLLSIGAHLSQDVALNGFHAQAGWIMFLAVTIALMAAAYQSSFFRVDAARPQSGNSATRLAAALLAPFIALMAARILGAAFGPHMHWPGVIATALPIAVLWLYRDAIRPLIGRLDGEAIAIGLGVGALWIATDPRTANPALGAWLSDQGNIGAALWLSLRVFGFALVVPIAEELAFRGYLYRALSRRRFEEADAGAFSIVAFAATSLLFGAMHGRWLAGALAGAAFALALYRSKSLSGPIAAHVCANGLIALYALTTGAWGLI